MIKPFGQLRQSFRAYRHQYPLTSLFAAIGLTVTILVVLAQLAYPPGRTLPFVRVQSMRVGNAATTLQISTSLESRYKEARLRIKTDNAQFNWSLEEAGIDVLPAVTARKAADYPLYKRLIPFSSLGIMLHRNVPVSVRYDDARVRYHARIVQKDSFVPAANAGIAVKDGTVQLVAARPSRNYSADVTLAAIKSAMERPEPSASAQIRLHSKVHKAPRPDEKVRPLLAQAQRIVDTQIVLKTDSSQTPVEKTTVASWLDFPENPRTKELSLSVRDENVRAYLGSMQSSTLKAPGMTVVSTVDGQEIARSQGAPGSGIDVDKAAQSIAAAVKSGQVASIRLPVKQIQPEAAYNRQYTDTPAGLTALLNDVASSKGNYAISVTELSGLGRSGNANGDKQFEAASTYKLFVAYAMLRYVETGQLHWNDKVNGEQAASTCFEAMIVRSDNPCAEAVGRRIGWSNIERMIRGQGLNHTELRASFYTTSNDLALFLQKLHSGALLSASSRDQLLGAMQRQIYRSGVPTGVRAAVANKVGFLGGYLHDAAIAYGPKGPYIIVVLSGGSSWPQLANAAAQVHAYLAR